MSSFIIVHSSPPLPCLSPPRRGRGRAACSTHPTLQPEFATLPIPCDDAMFVPLPPPRPRSFLPSPKIGICRASTARLPLLLSRAALALGVTSFGRSTRSHIANASGALLSRAGLDTAAIERTRRIPLVPSTIISYPFVPQRSRQEMLRQSWC